MPTRKYKTLYQSWRQITITTTYREEAAKHGRWPSAKPHQGRRERERRVRQGAPKCG